MPSFDVVSEINAHELTNAVDQANREIGNRYDFKGADAQIEQQEGALLLSAQSRYQVEQMKPVLMQKMAKRGIDLSCADAQDIQEANLRARQQIVLKQGIDAESGKKLVKLIKESKLKVQAQIQGDSVRVSGKKRDDLQAVMALLKGAEAGLPLQFENFRD